LSREVITFALKKIMQAVRHSGAIPRSLKHLKKTKKPLVLATNGKAEAAAEDAKPISAFLIS
jgi:hypothetical protein